ncbi:MAG: hypothetical protein KJ069_28600 [Anaerolineae bacterium]|nr:hypothetical protein [Anaerolineae bacterium]
MSLKHTAFLFDYPKFQSTIAPLVRSLDTGDFAPLQEKAAQIRHEISLDETWILHDKGTHLMDDYNLIRDSRYQNGLWGHWLLIILSSFLQPIVSLEYDWSKLSTTLRSLEWVEEDVEKVIFGLPTVWLVKPRAPYQRGMVTEWTSPYWYWIRPMRCTYCGWLPVEEMNRLQKRLRDQQMLIESDVTTSIQLPPNVSLVNAQISEELDPNYWY